MAPPVLAGLAIGSTVLGGAVSFIGQQQQASANAKLSKQNADIQRQSGERQESLIRRETAMQVDAVSRDRRRRLSALRAAAGASGFRLQGSMTDLFADDAAENARDIFNIRYTGMIRSQDARFGHALAERRERVNLANARSQRVSAFGTLLGTASDVFGILSTEAMRRKSAGNS